MKRRVSLGLLLALACQPDSPVEPGKNRAPTASIAGPGQGIEGTAITWNATGSRDRDGDTLTYAWDFGDGGTGTGPQPQHAYRDEGSYETTLIVTDSHGASDTTGKRIVIANAPPVIALTVPTTPLPLGTPATIQVAFSDPGVLDSLTATANWGDSTSSAIANGSSSHAYTAAGNYIVIVTVRDNDGGVSTKVAPGWIRISAPHPNQPPVAHIDGPSAAREGQNVEFTTSGSSDPDGDHLTFIWDFGNGFTSTTGNVYESGKWAVYNDNGLYTVTLVVKDDSGAVDTAKATITVANVAPVIARLSPPSQQAVGISAAAWIAFSDSGSADTHVGTIRWGDGTRDSLATEATAWVPDSVRHTYAHPGVYWVSLTVRDDEGAADSATAQSPVIVFDAAERKTVAGYEVLDLGTLGGNSALPADFNDKGQIVGSSLTAGGATHGFFWDGGVMQDLGTLGELNSEGTRINEVGLIAGAVWTGRGEDNRHSIAAIWRIGNGTILDAPAGPLFVDAMNESGDILWSQPGHESGKNWLWRNGAWLSMDNWFSLKQASNAVINDHRQIVIREGFRAGLWEADSLHDLGVLSWRCAGDPNCGWSFPTDINERGEIVGTSSDTGKVDRFVLWKNGTIRALALAPEAPGWAKHAYINDRGQIAVSAGGEAFFWSDGNRQSLVAPGPLEVNGLNENGEVAGTFLTGTGEQHVFLWSQNRGMVDLGTGPHGFTAAWAVGINSRGDIIGRTAPCELDYYHKCGSPRQVRAILWRHAP